MWFVFYGPLSCCWIYNWLWNWWLDNSPLEFNSCDPRKVLNLPRERSVFISCMLFLWPHLSWSNVCLFIYLFIFIYVDFVYLFIFVFDISRSGHLWSPKMFYNFFYTSPTQRAEVVAQSRHKPSLDLSPNITQLIWIMFGLPI